MNTDDNIAVVRRFIDEVVNGGDISAIDNFWAKDMIWRGGSLGEYHGLDAYKEFAAANAEGAFSDMHLDIKQIMTDGDAVIVHFTNSGRNTGPFLGLPATGKSAVWPGTGIYRIRDGKIAEGTFVEDILGLLLQLGITTLPATL
jgi:steroid delta-isomerase-like uncharacterized protein